MIDLETLGTKPDSVILSIGAVFFDEKTKQIGPTFYMRPSVQDQLDIGRKVDADTIKWWMSQSDAAKKVFGEKQLPTRDVLTMFVNWFKQNNKQAYVWGNGSTFDISMMENIIRMFNAEPPWGYNKVMDQRTYRRFQAKGERVIKSGVDHNALDDAISQAKFVLQYL